MGGGVGETFGDSSFYIGRMLHPTGLVGSVPHFEEPVSDDHALGLCPTLKSLCPMIMLLGASQAGVDWGE